MSMANLWHFGPVVRPVGGSEIIRAGQLTGPASVVAARGSRDALEAAGYLEEFEPDLPHPYGWKRTPVEAIHPDTLRRVAALVPAPAPPPPEPVLVEDALAERRAAVMSHASSIMEGAVSQYIWPEAVSWSQLSQEVEVYLETAVMGPVLLAEVDGLSEAEILERCTYIQQKAAAFTSIRGRCVRCRQVHLAALDELALTEGVTGEQIAAYDFTGPGTNWPSLEVQ
jgi:hypothetical protein